MSESDVACGKKMALRLIKIISLLWIAGSYFYQATITLLLVPGIEAPIPAAISYLGICLSFAWVSHDMIEGWFYPNRSRIGRAQTRFLEKIGSNTRKKRGY